MIYLKIILALLKNDIKIFLRDWKALILILIMPFLCIWLFSYALSPLLGRTSFVEPFQIALVDNEDTVQTRMLIRQLEELRIFSGIVRTGEEEARRMLEKNEVASIIILPPAFSESIAVGENRPVRVIGSRADLVKSQIVKMIAISSANLVTAGQSAINTIYFYNEKAGVVGSMLEKDFHDSTMSFFIKALSRNEIFTDVGSGTEFALSPAEHYTAALIVIFMMFAGVPAMKLLVWERNSGMAGRLAASPVKGWQVVVSKFLITALLCVAQFSIVLLLSLRFLKNYWGAPVVNILVMLAGMIFTVSAWSVFVSVVCRSAASADIIGNVGILLMAVLGGSIYPLNSMPEFVRTLSGLTVNRWAMDGFMIIFSGNDALRVYNQAGALAAVGAVFMLTALILMKFKVNRT